MWISLEGGPHNDLSSLIIGLDDFDSIKQFLEDKKSYDKMVKDLANQQRFI